MSLERWLANLTLFDARYDVTAGNEWGGDG